jgi:hypothetical protein
MDLLIRTMTDKWQTWPLVREGAPIEQDSSFHKKIWSWASGGCSIPRLPDWLIVSRNMTLTLTLTLRLQNPRPAEEWTEGISWDDSRRWLKRNGQKGVRLYKEDFIMCCSYSETFIFTVLKSVARIRLIKTEHLSVWVKMKFRRCRPAIAL